MRRLLMIALAGLAAFAIGTGGAMAATIVAHRGTSGSSSHDDNTMGAFRYAIAQGARYIETDGRPTKDGKIVLSHSDELAAQTNCSGRISQTYYSTLAANCRTRAHGQPIPLLSELLALTAPAGITVEVEMKSPLVGTGGRVWTDAEVLTFWNLIKTKSVRVTAFGGNPLSSMAKVKKRDAASSYTRAYGYISNDTSYVRGLTAEQIKAKGGTAGAKTYTIVVPTSIPKSLIDKWKAGGVAVEMWPGRTAADYALLEQKNPTRWVIDDVGKFNARG